jgi:hypothetical protein
MKHNKTNRAGLGLVITRQLGILLTLGGALALSACGGGASNTENPNVNTGPTTTNYSGPPPATTDVQNFQNNLWNNIHDNNHCGSCHDAGGQGGLDFANNSDINAAYQAANTVVNLNDPAASKMVTKFSNGSTHYCWLGSDAQSQAACASALTSWITNWANASAGSAAGTTIKLIAPTIQAPQPSIVLPSTPPLTFSSGNGGDNLYNLVTTHCSGCHVPQPTKTTAAVYPEFAQSDIQTDWDFIRSIPLVDPNNPKNSQLYIRMADDGHNCFGTNCADAANQMLGAINYLLTDSSMSTAAGQTVLNNEVTSDAVNLLSDGIVASGGGRYETNQIALYTFMLGSGNLILDRSGVTPAMNLTLSTTNPASPNGEGVDYQWLPNWGVEFDSKFAKAQASTSTSSKLTTLIGGTGEYSIEAWVVPANITQTNANIVSYSGSQTTRNFTLSQNAAEYEDANRSTSTATDGNGLPYLDTTGSQLLASLQHVVVTYDPINGRRFYINGVLDSTDTDPVPTGALSNWDSSFALVLGNETDGSSPWKGAIRMLAIHDRALTPAQVKQNYDAGVGQSYYLLFNVSQHLPNMGCTGSNGEPYCFIVMKASVYDSYSYLLSTPRFVDINDGNVPFTGSFLLKGLRIGVNGVEAAGDQTYQDLDICVNGSNGGCGDTNSTGAAYNNQKGPDEGASLSTIGTVIRMQFGPKAVNGYPADMLFLTFEQLGNAVTSVTYDAPVTVTSVPPAVSPPSGLNDIMIHTFGEINAALSAITGVASTNPAINYDSSIDGGNASSDGTYTSVIQAMPLTHNASTYVAANQMAVTQLAMSYCSELVDGNGTISPASYFPGFGFSGNSPPSTVDFTQSATRAAIIDPLLSHVMNVEYTSGSVTDSLSIMPPENTVHTYLDELIDGSTTNGITGLDASCAGGPSSCTGSEAANIIKATCAAAAASGPMLLK